MSSHDLRRQLAELRQMVEALQPAQRVEDYLAAWCAEQGEVFESRRDAIVEALLAEGHYSFKVQMPDDPPDFPSEFLIWWYRREQLPLCVRLMKVRDWRAVHYGEYGYREISSSRVENEPPALSATALPSFSDSTGGEEGGRYTRQRDARSDLAVARTGGHPEPSATPADTAADSGDGSDAAEREAEREAELAAEIARVQAAIAALEEQIGQQQERPPLAQRQVERSVFRTKTF